MADTSVVFITTLDAPAFVYSGMGAQWWGMGGELYRDERVFRAAIDRCDALWRALGGPSLLRCLEGHGAPMIDPADAQPAGLALQVALTALWRARGVQPGAVVGHSFGELAAAWAAGVISLEQAVTIAYHRSAVEQTLAGRGGMLAVGLGEQETARLIAGRAELAIAAVNGFAAVTVAGAPAALADLAAELELRDVACRALHVSVAYHSAQQDQLRDEFLARLGTVVPQPAELPLYSTVAAGGAVLDAGYWWDNIREPVRFLPAIERMVEAGWRSFVEVGPHPALAALVLEADRAAVVVPSMRRGRPQVETFRRSFTRVSDTLETWRPRSMSMS